MGGGREGGRGGCVGRGRDEERVWRGVVSVTVLEVWSRGVNDHCKRVKDVRKLKMCGEERLKLCGDKLNVSEVTSIKKAYSVVVSVPIHICTSIAECKIVSFL